MTRLIILADENTILMLEDPRKADIVALEINASGLLPGGDALKSLPAGLHWSASRQGSAVVAVPAENRDPAGRKTPRLPSRELEALQALANGYTIREISSRMGVSMRSVNVYIARLMARLGVRTREQSVGRGVALGLCQVPDEDEDAE
jgi:DNA-binding NarL/FixJ family response regulator